MLGRSSSCCIPIFLLIYCWVHLSGVVARSTPRLFFDTASNDGSGLLLV